MSDSDDSDRSEPKTAFNSVDPQRNFSLSIGERIRALTIGAPAYATRKKSIEDQEASHVRTLVVLYDTLTGRGRERAAVVQALHEKAAAFNLEKLNRLVDAHNQYYPIEANLPCDPRTGEYLIYGRPWSPERPWTVTRLVETALAKIAARSED